MCDVSVAYWGQEGDLGEVGGALRRGWAVESGWWVVELRERWCRLGVEPSRSSLQ